MTTEIELKYLVLGDNPAETITDIFNRENIQFSYQEKQLANCYFDTPDLNLRHHDMGLRVRCNNRHIEQTIKTAGQVVGGLHSRPEYNVDITSNQPVLTLFPDEIWSPDQCIADIQTRLIDLFSTNFKRCIWLVSDNRGNVVELAFDHGHIVSSAKKEQINELELELVKGDESALFTLAKILFQGLALRPGLKSKAARGYALWQEQPVSDTVIQQRYMCTNAATSVHDAFTLGLGLGLTRLQTSIDHYLNSENLLELVEIKANLALIRHGFWLFEQYLTPLELTIRTELSHFIQLLAWVDNAIHLQELTNKTGNYRKKLDLSKQLILQLNIEQRRFPNTDEICQLIHSSRFNLLQLSILQLFLSRSKTPVGADEFGAHALIQFSQEKIQYSLTEVSAQLRSEQSLTSQQYIALSKLLYRSSLTGIWLAGLFDNELREKFRLPWLDLQQGIAELQSLWIIQQQLEKLDEAPQKLVQWQHSKVESLLLALNNSKAIAVAMPPYWLNFS